jgi:hypothetical protein
MRCTNCANIHKAKVADARCKESRTAKTLKMKNGLEILNNVFGQEIVRNSDAYKYINRS